MKLKVALKIAEEQDMTHVAVDADGAINGYFTLSTIEVWGYTWAFKDCSWYNDKRHLGFYTGSKNWKDTKRLTSMGKVTHELRARG